MLHWETYGEYPNQTSKLEEIPVPYSYSKSGDVITIAGIVIIENENANGLQLKYDREANVLAIEASLNGQQLRYTFKKK